MSVLTDAGESVRRRGFLDGEQKPAFRDDVLAAQNARLLEEVGEWSRSLRQVGGPAQMELADIVIVCAAIAEHLGWNLDELVQAKCLSDEMERGYQHNGDGSGGALTSLPGHWYDEKGKAKFYGGG